MRSKRPKGFTLIEVVAALAIVSIALLGLLRLHLISIRTTENAEVLGQAVLLAQEKMAEALCGSYPQMGTQSGAAQADGARFIWRTDVTDTRPSSPQLDLNFTGLRRLSVDVAWQKGSGEKHIQLTTYVADSSIHEQPVQK